MNKEEALLKINEGDGDFQVFTKEEHETFLKNLTETEPFKAKLGERISEITKKFDDDLYDILGKRRDSSVKTHEFMKAEVKSLFDNYKESSKKVQDLEVAVKDTSGKAAIEQAQRELESVRQKHQTALQEWESKYKELETGTHSMKISNELDKGLNGLIFKDVKLVPEDVRNIHINVVKSELAKMAEFIDGKLIFKDDKGDIVRDEKLNPLGPKEILRMRLKPILNEGRTQPGPGLKDKEPLIETKDGKIDVTLILPDTVKTNADLTEFLLKSGLKRNTPEYLAAYGKYVENLTKV